MADETAGGSERASSDYSCCVNMDISHSLDLLSFLWGGQCECLNFRV